MGAFFTNVQVRGGDRAAIARALRADASASGMDEHEGEGADRTILILPPDEGGWVAVFDERTESQDLASLEALGALLSRVTSSPAVSVLVHDSDVLDLRLYRDGARVDRYDSFPGYFEGKASKKQKAAAAGHPERWSDLLAGGSVEELRAAWTGEDLFAEGALARTCELIGCDPRRASVGYRYALQEALPEGTLTLRFRARERPAYEQQAEGPTVLEQHAFLPGEQQAAVGDELRLSHSTRNVGGGSEGISVVTWGSALGDGLVSIERFELLVGDVSAGAKHRMLVPEERRSTDGEPMRVARVDEQPLPAGVADLEQLWGAGVDPGRVMRAMMSSTVHVNVVGRVLAPGRGTLGVALVPHANREEGASATSFTLAIDPPLPRPLRMSTDDRFQGHASHVLRPLAGDRYLVLLVSFDDERGASAALARRAIEESVAILGAGWNVERATYRRDPGKRPGTGSGKASALFRGKRLASLIASFADELSVGLEMREGPAFDPNEGPLAPAWGVAFGTTILPMHEEERAPALGLYADVSVIGEEKARGLREAWSAIAERAIADGAAAQAVLLRSGWTPSIATLQQTAYELVCGIDPPVTTLRAWVRRWVRVPGNDRLWLGRELASRVTGEVRAALAKIATVSTCGEGVRVELADRARERALEEALAPLLPSHEDAAPIARELYGRPTT